MPAKRKPESWVNKTCHVCKVGFARRKYRPETKSGRYFCSNRCEGISRKKRVALICEACGVSCEKTKTHIYKHVYCSVECHNKGKTGRPLGNGKWAQLGRKEYMRQYLKPYLKEWGKKNRAKKNDSTAKWRARKKQATPAWANQSIILFYYEIATMITRETGMKVHVDHIIPLTSDVVCGLHCEQNLQLMSAGDNIRKSNKLIKFTEVSTVFRHAFTSKDSWVCRGPAK